MILRRDGLMTSVNILRLYLPNYCHNKKFKKLNLAAYTCSGELPQR